MVQNTIVFIINYYSIFFTWEGANKSVISLSAMKIDFTLSIGITLIIISHQLKTALMCFEQGENRRCVLMFY